MSRHHSRHSLSFTPSQYRTDEKLTEQIKSIIRDLLAENVSSLNDTLSYINTAKFTLYNNSHPRSNPIMYYSINDYCQKLLSDEIINNRILKCNQFQRIFSFFRCHKNIEGDAFVHFLASTIQQLLNQDNPDQKVLKSRQQSRSGINKRLSFHSRQPTDILSNPSLSPTQRNECAPKDPYNSPMTPTGPLVIHDDPLSPTSCHSRRNSFQPMNLSVCVSATSLENKSPNSDVKDELSTLIEQPGELRQEQNFLIWTLLSCKMILMSQESPSYTNLPHFISGQKIYSVSSSKRTSTMSSNNLSLQFNSQKGRKAANGTVPQNRVLALRLIYRILETCNDYFLSTNNCSAILLRHFVVPSLMLTCMKLEDSFDTNPNSPPTNQTASFELVLKCLTLLIENHQSLLVNEIGVFLQDILLPLLESAYCRFEHKRVVLEWFNNYFKTPSALINLYSNYDNRPLHRFSSFKITEFTIIETLISILCSMIESRLPSTTHSAELNDASQVQRLAIKLLTRLLQLQADWIAVPGLQSKSVENEEISPLGSPSRAIHSISSDRLQRSEKLISASPLDESPRTSVQTNSPVKVLGESAFERYQSQKARAQQINELVHEANDKLNNAIQSFLSLDDSNALPSQIAAFLYNHSNLIDKRAIGDFLSSTDDHYRTHIEYENIRSHYVSQCMDFVDLTFDSALRLFLCDSGFRLPGESQKIDRLLEAFCKQYVLDNPGVFRNSSSAFIVSFALVMLNTDIHDPRLRSETYPSNRVLKQMTVEQFIANLRGVDNGADFDRNFLIDLYYGIYNQAIEWRDLPQNQQNSNLLLTSSSSIAVDGFFPLSEVGTDEKRKNGRKALESIVRRAIVRLRHLQHHRYPFLPYPRSVFHNHSIIQSLFDTNWYRLVQTISHKSDACMRRSSNQLSPINDVDVLHTCIDALAYGSCIAIVLGLSTERMAFIRALAKITYIEYQSSNFDDLPTPIRSPSVPKVLPDTLTLNRRLLQGAHLTQQEWTKATDILIANKHTTLACNKIHQTVLQVKAHINAERRINVLKRIEIETGNELVLINDPHRHLIKSGPLYRIKSKNVNKKLLYTFFLFNDLLIYASEGGGNKYKIHRVLQLALCLLQDIKTSSNQSQTRPPTASTITNNFIFRIISPQKSFTVACRSSEEKIEWVSLINMCIRECLNKRKRYIRDASPATIAMHRKQLSGQNVLSSSSGSNNVERNNQTIATLSFNNAIRSNSRHDDSSDTTATQSSIRNVASENNLEALIENKNEEIEISSTLPNNISSVASIFQIQPMHNNTFTPLASSPALMQRVASVSNTTLTTTGSSLPYILPQVSFESSRFSRDSSMSQSQTPNNLEHPLTHVDPRLLQPSVSQSQSLSISTVSTSAFQQNSKRTQSTFSVSTVQTQPNPNPYCSLCLRCFTIFRRKYKCRCCYQTICNECCMNKFRVNNYIGRKDTVTKSKQQSSQTSESKLPKVWVCDACYGVLTEMIKEDTTIQTVVEK